MEMDQDWIAEKLATLDAKVLIEKVYLSFQEEIYVGSALMADYGTRHESNPSMFDPEAHPEYRQEIETFVRQKATEHVLEEIENLAFDLEIQDDKIVVWRSVVVAKDWVDNGLRDRHLGVCWASDEQFAIAHGGGIGDQGKSVVRIKALVDFWDVDWSETIILNAADYYTVGEESEIRLKDDALADVLSIEDLDDDAILADFSASPERMAAGEEAFRRVTAMGL